MDVFARRSSGRERLTANSQSAEGKDGFFKISDKAGLLFTALQCFSKRDINLQKIESRPKGTQIGDYIFIIDFDVHVNDEKIISLLVMEKFFKLTNQNGKEITQANYKDKIYVADFFFTTCQDICPIMTKNMYRLQEELKNDNDVLFLSNIFIIFS